MAEKHLMKIEKFIRLEIQHHLDNVLYTLSHAAHSGSPLDVAELVLLALRLEEMRSAGRELLTDLQNDRQPSATCDLPSAPEMLLAE